MKYANPRCSIVVQLSHLARANSISQGLAQAGLRVVTQVKPGEQTVLITDLPQPNHENVTAVIGIGTPNYQVDLCFAADVPDSEIVTACRLLTKIVRQQHRIKKLKRKKQQWKLAALTDPLTQLASRRAWERFGLNQAKRAILNEHVLTLAILDVDRLKQVNQEHGLQMGDWLLECLGRVLESRIKQHLVARIGGDEFGILGIDVSVDQMRDLITLVQDQFCLLVQTKLPEFGSVSFGISTQQCSAENEPKVMLESMVEAADKQLRTAKNDRN
ncbi:MAG: GGDEF domain-containing protein [Pirellulales bacterium]